jgi:hypothetical protein
MTGEPGFRLPLFVRSSIDDAGLSPGAFRVLGHLARRAGNKRVAFPGIRDIAKTCRMNRGTVIKAIRELVQFRLVVANRKPGRRTAYYLFPELKAGPEVLSKTLPVQVAGVPYLGNSEETEGVTHLGNGVLPTQVTECYLTNRADQVPEPLELPEGTPIRYSNKVLHRSADALTHSLPYEKEEEVTEKEDPSIRSKRSAEPAENSCSVTKSETKDGPQHDRARRRRHPCTPEQRPESEAEVIAYVRSLGYQEEDGKYMWANWKGNGFTNAGRPIRNWKATIDSRVYQGFLPSQKKLAERAANKLPVRNLI